MSNQIVSGVIVKNIQNICEVKKYCLGACVRGAAIHVTIISLKVYKYKWTGLLQVTIRQDTCILLVDNNYIAYKLLNITESIAEQIEKISADQQLFYKPFIEGPLRSASLQQKMFFWLVATRPRRSFIVTGFRIKNNRPRDGFKPMIRVTSLEPATARVLRDFKNLVPTERNRPIPGVS